MLSKANRPLRSVHTKDVKQTHARRNTRKELCKHDGVCLACFCGFDWVSSVHTRKRVEVTANKLKNAISFS